MRSRTLHPGWAILAAVLILLAVKAFFLDAAVVDGPSMSPTLKPGSVVFVLRCAYGLRALSGKGYIFRWASPRRGDIVASASPRDGLPIVKRVAAVGSVSLSYVAGRLVGPGVDASISAALAARIGSALAIPEGSLFLLGDNPPESLDSREYGPVSIESISGKVLLFGSKALP
jgi:signal peptidase I